MPTKFQSNVAPTYGRFPLTPVRGERARLWDADGKEYLDFGGGVAVNSLGHCHPKVSEAIAKYAGTLMNAHDFTTPIKVKGGSGPQKSKMSPKHRY